METGEYFNFNTDIPVTASDVPTVLNPEYWFVTGSRLIMNGIDIIFQARTLDILHTIAFGFSMFFITLLAYCFVRMFEIRAKEH